MIKKRFIVFFNALIVILVLVDRLIKYLSMYKLPAEGVYFIYKPIPVFIKFFKNPFIAFSIPVPLFVIILLSMAILLFILFFLVKNYQTNHWLANFSLLLIAGGAISNFIDRIVFNFVIDYMHISVLPVFNLADIMIMLGVIIFLIKNNKEDCYVKQER